MFAFLKTFLVLLVFAIPALANSANGHRVALVIGIGTYDAAPNLPNPENDARTIARELWKSGFEVIELINPDIASARAGLQVMSDRLQPGAQAVFFFAGHGIQIDGVNYLLTRDAPIRSASDVLKHALSADEIVSTLTGSGAALSVIILDACRDNPYSSSGLTPQSENAIDRLSAGQDDPTAQISGLAPINLPAQSNEIVLGFSTAPGSVAFDGPENGNSPYSAALARHMAEPGLEIGHLFRRVRADVRRATEGRQLPWVSSSLESSFYFLSADSVPTLVAERTTDTLGLLPPESILDSGFWESAKTSNSAAAYEVYLRYFPSGAYRDEAVELLSDPAVRENRPSRGDNLDMAGYMADGTLLPTRTVLSAGTGGLLELPFAGVSPADPSLRIRIVESPTALNLAPPEGAALDALTMEDFAKLRYSLERSRFGDIGPIKIDFTTDTGSYSATTELTVDINACDMVAGYQYDPNRVGRGVRLELIRPELAIPACQSAVERHPEVLRFRALLARAYRVAGDYAEARRWNEAAVAASYPSAILMEGQMHRLGQGGPVDLPRAADLYRRAADLGEVGAVAELGMLMLSGSGVPRDEAGGLDLIRSAAATGHDWSHNLLGQAYQFGWGVPKSYMEAYDWYLKGAALGDISSKMRLGQFNEFGWGVLRDAGAAFRWYQSAAGQGAGYAQARLGRLFAEGQGTDRDPVAAVSWYQKAADRGEPEGIYWLGDALMSGTGIAADPARGEALVRKAADLGHGRALVRLGDMSAESDPRIALQYYESALAAGYQAARRPLARALAEGYSGAPDGQRAVALLDDASAEGDVWAMLDLARLLADGKVVLQDPVRSAELARAAAEGGNGWAWRQHALNLEKGFGVPVDHSKAFAAMQRAAEESNPRAKFDLGRYYADGIGIDADPVAAAVWMARAAGMNDPVVATTARTRLEAMDSETILSAIETSAGSGTNAGTLGAALVDDLIRLSQEP
jgi:hypothetical protein